MCNEQVSATIPSSTFFGLRGLCSSIQKLTWTWLITMSLTFKRVGFKTRAMIQIMASQRLRISRISLRPCSRSLFTTWTITINLQIWACIVRSSNLSTTLKACITMNGVSDGYIFCHAFPLLCVCEIWQEIRWVFDFVCICLNNHSILNLSLSPKIWRRYDLEGDLHGLTNAIFLWSSRHRQGKCKSMV